MQRLVNFRKCIFVHVSYRQILRKKQVEAMMMPASAGSQPAEQPHGRACRAQAERAATATASSLSRSRQAAETPHKASRCATAAMKIDLSTIPRPPVKKAAHALLRWQRAHKIYQETGDRGTATCGAEGAGAAEPCGVQSGGSFIDANPVQKAMISRRWDSSKESTRQQAENAYGFAVQGHEAPPYDGVFVRAGVCSGLPRFENENGMNLYYHATHQAWCLKGSFTPFAESRKSWVRSPDGGLPTGARTWQVGKNSDAISGWRDSTLILTAFATKQDTQEYIARRQAMLDSAASVARNQAAALAQGLEIVGFGSAPAGVQDDNKYGGLGPDSLRIKPHLGNDHISSDDEEEDDGVECASEIAQLNQADCNNVKKALGDESRDEDRAAKSEAMAWRERRGMLRMLSNPNLLSTRMTAKDHADGVYRLVGTHKGWPYYRNTANGMHMYRHQESQCWVLRRKFTPYSDACVAWLRTPDGEIPLAPPTSSSPDKATVAAGATTARASLAIYGGLGQASPMDTKHVRQPVWHYCVNKQWLEHKNIRVQAVHDPAKDFAP